MADEKKTGPKPLDLLCRFCGTKTGEYVVPARFEGIEIEPAQLGIMDSRCDSCTATYGTVQEAERAIEAAMSGVGGADDSLKAKMLEDAGWSAPAAVKLANAERSSRLKAIEADEKKAAAEAEIAAK